MTLWYKLGYNHAFNLATEEKRRAMFFNKPNFSGKTFLIVEDTQGERVFLKRTLEGAGGRVEIAENGQIGVEKARSLKPDLILMDCEMPVLSGIEACKQIKEINECQNIPIIFLTGLDTPKNIIDCFEVDAENYLSKPISGRLLLQEIEKTLNTISSEQSNH